MPTPKSLHLKTSMSGTVIAFLLVLGLGACKPQSVAHMTAASGQHTTVPEAGETPAAVMDAAEAASAEAMAKSLSNVLAERNAEDDTACRDQLGQAAAEKLAKQCRAVSPATHPPCNVANACAMMEDEIKRSCDMYGPNDSRPEACDAG